MRKPCQVSTVPRAWRNDCKLIRNINKDSHGASCRVMSNGTKLGFGCSDWLTGGEVVSDGPRRAHNGVTHSAAHSTLHADADHPAADQRHSPFSSLRSPLRRSLSARSSLSRSTVVAARARTFTPAPVHLTPDICYPANTTVAGSGSPRTKGNLGGGTSPDLYGE